MLLLLNVIFGLLAGWLALYIMRKASAPEPVSWIVAVIVAIVVYGLNIAAQLVTG